MNMLSHDSARSRPPSVVRSSATLRRHAGIDGRLLINAGEASPPSS
jgi:hypothetical protein